MIHTFIYSMHKVMANRNQGQSGPFKMTFRQGAYGILKKDSHLKKPWTIGQDPRARRISFVHRSWPTLV
jgi:hypothetical protein